MKILQFVKKAALNVWESVVSVAKSFWQNVRDIISTLLFLVGVVFVTQMITVVGQKFGVDIHPVRDFVFAIAKFAAVLLCGVGYLTHVTFRQSLGKFDNSDEFMNVWNNILTPKDRFEWFMKAVGIGIVAAALCFAVGV